MIFGWGRAFGHDHSEFEANFTPLDILIGIVVHVQPYQFKTAVMIKMNSRVVATLCFEDYAAAVSFLRHLYGFGDQSLPNSLAAMIFVDPNVGYPESIVPIFHGKFNKPEQTITLKNAVIFWGD